MEPTEDLEPTPATMPEEPEATPAENPEMPAPTPEPLSPPSLSSPSLSEADALTAARRMQLLSEAEERGYRRGRREAAPASSPASQTPLWGNPRREESREFPETDSIQIDGEFLTRIRPTIWD